jgi:hypothetical protein
MFLMNRSLVIIRPKEPFLFWLNQVPNDDGIELTLSQICSDCTSLLIDEYQEPEEAIQWIDEHFEKIFEMELSSWYDDETLWPQDRSLKTFWEWFHVEVHSTVVDTVIN